MLKIGWGSIGIYKNLSKVSGILREQCLKTGKISNFKRDLTVNLPGISTELQYFQLEFQVGR